MPALVFAVKAGAVATPDSDETIRAIAALMERTIETFGLVRIAAPRLPLIISAGGSAYFDIVARALAPAEHTGDPGRLAYTLALRGWIAIMGGDWRGAAADLDRARALSRQGNQSWWSGRSWPSFNAWVHAWTRAEPSRL